MRPLVTASHHHTKSNAGTEEHGELVKTLNGARWRRDCEDRCRAVGILVKIGEAAEGLWLKCRGGVDRCVCVGDDCNSSRGSGDDRFGR